ncbi:hypothetical protein Tco_0152687 [Tanacetum coccineum]
MEANNSINRSDIQRQLYKALVEAYEADQILLDTYGDTVTIKRPRDGADDDEEERTEPRLKQTGVSKRRRSRKGTASISAPSDTTTKNCRRTPVTGTRTFTRNLLANRSHTFWSLRDKATGMSHMICARIGQEDKDRAEDNEEFGGDLSVVDLRG